MTHDQIMQAARERIAEIDREKARLEDERVKLQALLGAQPVTPAQFVPLPSLPVPQWWREPPWQPLDQWRPLPEVTWTPHTGLPTGTFTICTTGTVAPPAIDTFGTFGISADFPLLAFNEDFTPPNIVVGGPQRLPSDLRFTA